MGFKIAGLVLGFWMGLALCSLGENLYNSDTSAETQTDTLTRGNYSSGVISWVWDDTQAFHGKRSIRVDWDEKSRAITEHPTPLWPWMRWISVMSSPDLQIGEKYVFSFYAKASVDKYPLTVNMLPSAGWAFTPPGGNPSKTFNLSRKWKRYWITFIPRIKKGALLKGYSPVFNFKNSPVGTVWYDAVQIEKGNAPTPYKNNSPMNVGVSLNSAHWSNIYHPGESVIATIRVDMPPGTTQLQCKVVDYQGRTVKNFKRTVSGSQKINLPMDERLGWFKISAELISGNGKVMSSHSTNYIRIKKPVNIAPGLEPFSGIINNGLYNFFEISKKIGAKRMECWIRWKASCWGGVEIVPGKFNWNEVEWALKKGKEYGMLNKVVVNPFCVPDWYFDKSELAAARKTNSHLVLDKSKHGAWRKFIGEIARRYGDLIDEFELGGEDNGRLGQNQYYKNLYPSEVKNGCLVGGKPFDDLCAMEKTGAEEIRKTHPNMKIGAIRPSRGGDPDDLFFTKAMLKKIGKDFNVFPADYYFYPFDIGPSIQQKRAKSDGLFVIYNDTKKALAELGIGQPVYMSEFGMAVDIRFPDESVYRQYQAETMAKDFIVAKVAGYYAFDWFTGFGGPGSVRQYSFIMTQNLKIQSIAAAYSAVAQVVENVTKSEWLTPDRVTRIAVMRKHDGKGVAAVWSDKGYKLSFPLMKNIKATDLMGNPIQPAEDCLALSPAPLYIWCDNFNRLSESLSKAKIEMTEFCDIKFRMVTENIGRIQFVNNSNSSNLEINAVISIGGKKIKRIVDVPKGSSNTCNIPLAGKVVNVKAQAFGSKTVMERSFTLPSLISIIAGSHPKTLIAKAESRSDVIPGDPWVSWTGSDDLSVQIASSWDANNLYLRILVRDDIHFNKFSKNPWNGDSIQIGIDPKNNGSFYTSSTGNNKLNQDDFEFCLASGNDNKSHCVFSHGKNIFRPNNYTITRNEKMKTTTYKLDIPWKDLGVKPKLGMVLGMSFVVFDDDTGSGQSYYIPIGGGIAGGKNPVLYKKFVLK